MKANDINKIEDLFQFHKGTIKTPRLEPPPRGRGYFNSIKVRLKLRRSTVHRTAIHISIP